MARFQPKSQIKWFSSRNEWFRTESRFAAGISPKISEKVIGKSPQFPHRKPMCYLNKSKIKTKYYFLGARDRLQNNHNHEFSDTLINQLFQEQQLSNLRRNTIPPLAIIFAINWSVGYWWRRSGYWKKSTFQLFPSIITNVQPWLFRHTAKSILSSTTAIQFPTQHYPPTRQ